MTKATFKINNESYEFKEITLRTYYSITELDRENMSERELEYHIVNLMTGCPLEQMKKLKFNDWLLIWEEAKWRLSTIKGNADAIRPTIELNGIEYSLPEISDITIGEFADLEILQTSPNAGKRLNEVAAILYRPIKSKKGKKIVIEDYDNEGFEERKEIFMDLPLWAIKSANSFFLRSVQQSLENTAESLRSMTKISSMTPEQKETVQNLLTLLQDFGGQSSIDFQDMILSDLTQHLDSKYVRPLTLLRGKWTRIKDSASKYKRKLKSIFAKK